MQDGPELTPIIPHPLPAEESIEAESLPKPPGWWVRRLLACNPFYLVSAALLLFGLYRVSVDPNFLSKEIAQLCFNLSSLQGYELLLVGTAVMLARRKIWYDATLLVGLENGFVLVPFILISQAALIEQRVVWLLCVTAGLLALARFGSLKLWLRELHLPGTLLRLGAVVLTVNVTLPIVYRLLHEHKVGTHPTWGAAYFTNEYAWVALLPVLCALLNLVPASPLAHPRPWQSRWQPLGWYSLWLAGTVVHLYCLGYVYDFDLRRDLVAPALWALVWTVYRRRLELVPKLKAQANQALLVAPLLATLVAFGQPEDEGVFLMLSILNLGLYAGIYFCRPDRRLALHLVFISLVGLLGGLPEDWGRSLFSEFSRARAIGAGAALYFLLWAALSRNPKLGLVGALVSAGVVVALLGDRPVTPHWAVQAGLVFLLLHSLRWVDAAHEGATVLRGLAAVAWVAHTALWVHLGGAGWLSCLVALPVLGSYGLVRWLTGRWPSVVVLGAALLVLFCGPGEVTVGKLQSAPLGLLAVVGSFLLFGVGTLAALTKPRWNKEP